MKGKTIFMKKKKLNFSFKIVYKYSCWNKVDMNSDVCFKYFIKLN